MNPFVDNLLLRFSVTTQQRANNVRSLILSSSERLTEKHKYKTAFYYLEDHIPICYITIKKNTIIVGFVQGKLLEQKFSSLYGNQKQVRHFDATFDKNDDTLVSIILEAILLSHNK